jgi:glycosyltransferase involved in cell wall biosynthesis
MVDKSTVAPVAHHRIIFRDELAHWRWDARFGGTSKALARAIEPGNPLEVEIIAPSRQLVSIDLLCATYLRRITSSLFAELFDNNGNALACRTITGLDISDNAYHPFILCEDLALEPGAKCRLVVSSIDGSPDNCIGVWAHACSASDWDYGRSFVSFDRARTFVYGANAISPVKPKVFVVLPSPSVSGAPIAELADGLDGVALTVIDPQSVLSQRDLFSADLVIFAGVTGRQDFCGPNFDELCFELHRRGVVTLFYQIGGLPILPEVRYEGRHRVENRDLEQARRRCHYSLIDDGQPRLLRSTDFHESLLGNRRFDVALVRSAIENVRAARLPHVAVVTVLRDNSALIETFLDHVLRQSYVGRVTVVAIDEGRKGDCGARVQRFATTARRLAGDAFDVVLVRNAKNLGNCASFNAGVEAVNADLYVVIDSDCLMNRNFIGAHVFEHWFPDVDAVIGPADIETGIRSGTELLRSLERNPSAIEAENEPQDKVQSDGFVNVTARNFSFKRRALERGLLFDAEFAQAQAKEPGAGWTGVELGYRFYAAGAVIRSTDQAFSVHCSNHRSNARPRETQESIRGFWRLFKKHPDLALAARRWATDAYGRIIDRADADRTNADERDRLNLLFGEERRVLEPLLAGFQRGARRLRILTYRWHAPHQYELYKLPHDFTLATGLGNGFSDAWEYNQRPLRRNARMIPISQVDPRDYDLAILHFDENVLAARLGNGVIPPQWGLAFRYFLANFPDLPKAAICHGTVPFEGQYGVDPEPKRAFRLHEAERQRLVATLALAGVHVICNSHQALAEWGFADARVIWHGFDPQEFPECTRQRDILALTPDVHRPHYRGAWEQQTVVSLLTAGQRVETSTHAGGAIEDRNTNPFAVRHFRSYVDRIREFSVYLNTTLRSPMPRARGEAMMTGVIPVCLRNHDVDRFIENGVDGFYADTPEELAAFLNDLFHDRGRIVGMSQAARHKAMDVFNCDRYLAAWTRVLCELLDRGRPAPTADVSANLNAYLHAEGP